MDFQGMMDGLDALKSNNFNSTRILSLQIAADLLYNATSCLELHRFEAVATEEDLEKRAFELNANKTFLGGVHFKILEYFF